jgi:1-acyl-sn-glycerol-3-phosphate acyltransferase
MDFAPGPVGRLLEQVVSRIDGYVASRVEDDVLDWINGLIAQQDEFGFDDYGFQPDFLRYIMPFAQWVYRSYFRTEVHGIENIPDGRVLVIANHSGQIPIDGMVIGSASIFDRRPPRLLRAMVERYVPTLPFLSYWFARMGQVVGTPENCRRLLARDEAIMVFPEGVAGISKTFDKRYQLQRFGYGFMRLALEMDTPIVPVAVIGAEEQAPALANSERLGQLIGAPSFPITPTFPLLGPLGLLPLPVRYRLYFGEPMRFEGYSDDEDQVVGAHVAKVREAIAGLIARGLSERTSVFF